MQDHEATTKTNFGTTLVCVNVREAPLALKMRATRYIFTAPKKIFLVWPKMLLHLIGYEGSADCRATHENFFFMLIGSMPWVLLLPPHPSRALLERPLPFYRDSGAIVVAAAAEWKKKKQKWKNMTLFVCKLAEVVERREAPTSTPTPTSSKCNFQKEWYFTKIV